MTTEPTTRELTVRLGAQLSQLLREEIALAKTEAFASARQAMIGGQLFGAAAVAGLAGWLALAAAAIAGISRALPVWAAALIVAAALLAIAGALALLGKNRFKEGVPPLRFTASTLREDMTELSARARH